MAMPMYIRACADNIKSGKVRNILETAPVHILDMLYNLLPVNLFTKIHGIFHCTLQYLHTLGKIMIIYSTLNYAKLCKIQHAML